MNNDENKIYNYFWSCHIFTVDYHQYYLLSLSLSFFLFFIISCTINAIIIIIINYINATSCSKVYVFNFVWFCCSRQFTRPDVNENKASQFLCVFSANAPRLRFVWHQAQF